MNVISRIVLLITFPAFAPLFCACEGSGATASDNNVFKSIADVKKEIADENKHLLENREGLSECLNVMTTSRNVIRKKYEGFEVCFNPVNHTPDWVCWELLGSETEGKQKRSSKFLCDESVKGCPETSDYSRSGYDRGHMCPAADQKWSARAMRDCFYLTNICPQDHYLNSGAWATLEKKSRIWAVRDSALWIVAGPIYDEQSNQRIGEKGVRVPSAFFKVIAAPYLKHPRGIAFVYPNMSAPGNMRDYSMTIREIEQLTGLDFFYNLPDSMENIIETRASFTQWDKL